MQRPTGVTIIAILDFIGAAGLLILGLLSFVGGSLIAGFFNAASTANGATGAAPAAGWMAGIGIFIGAIFLAFAIFAIFIAIGLLKLKNWARITTIVLSALGLLGSLRNLAMAFHGGGMVYTIIVLAYYIWVIWYMLQPSVKTAFGQTAAA
jgi:hypothetical protein